MRFSYDTLLVDILKKLEAKSPFLKREDMQFSYVSEKYEEIEFPVTETSTMRDLTKDTHFYQPKV